MENTDRAVRLSKPAMRATKQLAKAIEGLTDASDLAQQRESGAEILRAVMLERANQDADDARTWIEVLYDKLLEIALVGAKGDEVKVKAIQVLLERAYGRAAVITDGKNASVVQQVAFHVSQLSELDRAASGPRPVGRPRKDAVIDAKSKLVTNLPNELEARLDDRTKGTDAAG